MLEAGYCCTASDKIVLVYWGKNDANVDLIT